MKKMLSDYKDELQSKFGYPNDLAEAIVLSAESLVDYYGVEMEDMILNAILDARVLVQQKPTMSVAGYKNRSDAYTSIPKIEFNGEMYRVSGVEKTITLPNTFDPNNVITYDTLIRNMDSLVRSHNREFVIEDDTLYARKGFETDIYKLENGEMHLDKKVGIGLETGLSAYNELVMMREYDADFDLKRGYDYERIPAGFLMDSLGLSDIMTASALTGDMEEFRAAIESNLDMSADEFISRLDVIHELEDKKSKNIGDDIAQKQSLEDLDRYYRDQISPMVSTLTRNVLENSELEKAI